MTTTFGTAGGAWDQPAHAQCIYKVWLFHAWAANTWRGGVVLFLARADPKRLNPRWVGRVRVNIQHRLRSLSHPFWAKHLGVVGDNLRSTNLVFTKPSLLRQRRKIKGINGGSGNGTKHGKARERERKKERKKEEKEWKLNKLEGWRRTCDWTSPTSRQHITNLALQPCHHIHRCHTFFLRG